MAIIMKRILRPFWSPDVDEDIFDLVSGINFLEQDPEWVASGRGHYGGRRRAHPYLRPRCPREGASCRGRRSQFSLVDWQESVELPGFHMKDLDVHKDGKQLTIKAVKEEGSPESEDGFTQKMKVRHVALPEGIVPFSLDINGEQDKFTIVGKRRVRKEDETLSPVDNACVVPDKTNSQKENGDTELRAGNQTPGQKDIKANIPSEKTETFESLTELAAADHNLVEVPGKQDKTHTEKMEVPEGENMALSNPKLLDIKLKIDGFDPDEIKVKATDNKIRVTAEHKEQSDGLFVFRKMDRLFDLPQGVDSDRVTSVINDNILTITELLPIMLDDEDSNVNNEQ